MTYATVMVCLGLDKPNDARLEVAGELAERFEADVVGIAAAQFAPPMYFADGAFAQGLIDQEETAIRKRLAELEERFRAANGEELWMGLCAHCLLAMAKALARAEGKL